MARQRKSPQLAKDILKRASALESEASNIFTLGQDIADYVMPRKSDIMRYTEKGAGSVEPDLYNLTAVRSAQILAAGQKDYLLSGRWFAYEPQPELEADDAAKQWFQKCTEIAMRELGRSNFYQKAHEMFLDRSAFPCANLMIEEGKRTTLNFRTDDFGTYMIAEDEEGIVDTIYRKVKLTARQAVMQFGEENVGNTVLDAYKDNAGGQDKCFDFIHAVYPRKSEDYDPSKQDDVNKPIASCYVSCADKIIVRESGYDEMPFAVTRFLKWGNNPYGYSPSIEALPTIRQVNFIEKHMDALAELKAFPRVLMPENIGDVDLRSGGITTFDPNQVGENLPKEWLTAGEYQVGKERIEMKDKAIRESYHVELFQMLQSIERQMTAYEVAQRLAEKVSAFSPTFDRLQFEVFNPVLMRTFAILYRGGKFPEPPQSVLVPRGDGSAEVAMPEVTLTGKLALLIKAEENNAFLQLMNLLAPLTSFAPQILDNYDLDKASRGIGRNFAVPVDWQRSADEVEGIRADRAEAQAQQNAMAQAESMSKSAANLSKATPQLQEAVMGAAGV